jgi:hypothetical protein
MLLVGCSFVHLFMAVGASGGWGRSTIAIAGLDAKLDQTAVRLLPLQPPATSRLQCGLICDFRSRVYCFFVKS